MLLVAQARAVKEVKIVGEELEEEEEWEEEEGEEEWEEEEW